MKDSPKITVIFLGVALGLALLTKVTAVLLVLPLVLLIYYLSMAKKERQIKALSGGFISFSAALIISGWYYLRNWIELGTPFLGGWQSASWWQDPGYRTTHDFLSFGVSLTHPIYSGIYSFWDSIYSTFWLDGFLSGTLPPPPWNYNFMLSGALFSLLRVRRFC
jgi:4-amino-4-deoxy-L-arabinose transferase-like glycosyltransferase